MKKLVALFVVVVFSASLFAQAQPQKKTEPAKANTETVKPAAEKKAMEAAKPAAEVKKAEPAAEKKVEATAEKAVKKHVKKAKKAEKTPEQPK